MNNGITIEMVGQEMTRIMGIDADMYQIPHDPDPYAMIMVTWPPSTNTPVLLAYIYIYTIHTDPSWEWENYKTVFLWDLKWDSEWFKSEWDHGFDAFPPETVRFPSFSGHQVNRFGFLSTNGRDLW